MPTEALPLSVEATMAGLIVWLAHQHSPVTQAMIELGWTATRV